MSSAVDGPAGDAFVSTGELPRRDLVGVIAPRVRDYILAMMPTAGPYGTSGEWLYDVGLPAHLGLSVTHGARSSIAVDSWR